MEQKRGTDILSLISAQRRPIMGAAALLIFIFHKYALLFSKGTFLYAVQEFCKRISFVGLDMFLLLSGLGLCYAIRKERLIVFYYRRLKRLVIPYLVIGVIVALTEHWSIGTVVGNLSGYNFFAKNMYSFMWYFQMITVLYLLFPLYHKLLTLSKHPIAFTGAMLCAWLLLAMAFAAPMKAAGREELYGFFNRIPIFLIGVLFGELAHGRRLYLSGWGWVLTVLMNILGLYLAYRVNNRGMQLLVPVPNCCVPNILMAISLTCILAKLFDALSRFGVGRFVRRVFDLFGIISLELYSAQRVVLLSWLKPFPWIASNWMKNLAMLLFTTAFAAALYWLGRGIWALCEWPYRAHQRRIAK